MTSVVAAAGGTPRPPLLTRLLLLDIGRQLSLLPLSVSRFMLRSYRSLLRHLKPAAPQHRCRRRARCDDGPPVRPLSAEEEASVAAAWGRGLAEDVVAGPGPGGLTLTRGDLRTLRGSTWVRERWTREAQDLPRALDSGRAPPTAQRRGRQLLLWTGAGGARAAPLKPGLADERLTRTSQAAARRRAAWLAARTAAQPASPATGAHRSSRRSPRRSPRRPRRAAAAGAPGSVSGSRPPPSVLCLSSFLFTRLTCGPCGYDYPAVARWTRRLGAPLASHDLVLVPINKPGAHWALAAARPPSRRVTYHDSIPSAAAAARDGALVGRYLVDEERTKAAAAAAAATGSAGVTVAAGAAPAPAPAPRPWRLPAGPSAGPCQGDGSACGVFACAWAEALARGRHRPHPALGQAYVPLLRRRIAADCLCGTVG